MESERFWQNSAKSLELMYISEGSILYLLIF